MQKIWIEKYRPVKLDDIVGQNKIIKRLKSYVVTRNMPHMLLAGPPGVGKTAATVSLVRELFGDIWQDNFMELNASDERGINVVRDKIKNFARSSTVGEYDFKILFLDEADALTNDAQSALRRTMEVHTDVCRFILSCNYSSKIIEPIQSRCAVYRFKPILNKYIAERINYIAACEDINIDQNSVNAIVYVAEGDMRRAINALQGAASVSKDITEESIYDVTSTAKPVDIIELINLSLNGDFLKSRAKLEYLTIDQGLDGGGIVKQMFKEIIDMTTISDRIKIAIIDYIGEIDFRLSEGANQQIQIGALLARLSTYRDSRLK